MKYSSWLKGFERLKESAQIAMCGAAVAVSLFAGKVSAQNPTTEKFKDNIETVTGAEGKKQISDWRNIFSTEGITSDKDRAFIERAMDFIGNTQTGREIFLEIGRLVSNDSLYAGDFLHNRKIEITCNSGPGEEGCFLIGREAGKSKITSLEVNISLTQLKTIGYRSGDKTLPFSVEQVLVHEFGHIIRDLNNAEKGIDEDKIKEKHLNSMWNVYGFIKSDSTFSEWLHLRSEVVSASEKLTVDENMPFRERKKVFRKMVSDEFIMNATEVALLNDEESGKAFSVYKTELDSIIKISEDNENSAMFWEKKLLKEEGEGVRTVYSVNEVFAKRPLDKPLSLAEQKDEKKLFGVKKHRDIGFKVKR